MKRHTKYDSYRLLGMSLWDWTIKTAREHAGSDCLIWTHGTNAYGYGIVRDPTTRKLVRAHRLAFWALYGYWPEPCGLHSCDNPPCFNPRHILPGTKSMNTQDCIVKGRLRPGKPAGEAAGATHLKDADVLAIRNLHAAGTGPKALAERFRVSTTAIWCIVTRRTWKHI